MEVGILVSIIIIFVSIGVLLYLKGRVDGAKIILFVVCMLAAYFIFLRLFGENGNWYLAIFIVISLVVRKAF